MANQDISKIIHINSGFQKMLEGEKIICLVDGQHYPPVTKNTLEVLRKIGAEIKALIFLGGTEKVEDAEEELGEADIDIFMSCSKEQLPIQNLRKAISKYDPKIVVDLSDEPVVDYGDRFEIASSVLQEGATYMGADFFFSPPNELNVLEKPSLSIIGTGKRVGKTGVSVSIARTLKGKGHEPVIVCMGRGGPPEPDYIDPKKIAMNADTLLKVAEKGGHAASDYWEDALLAQVSTVGCRRCGGGMAGNPFSSNVIKGALKTNNLKENLVIMEGSGSTFPPVKTEAKIVIIGASQPLDNILEYFGQYRINISDLAIITMCEEPMASEEKIEDIETGINELNPNIDIARTIFRPQPLKDITGKKVFVATTAPEDILPKIMEHIETEKGAEIVGHSNKLSNREALRKDLNRGLKEAEMLLTEIKAASIDVAGKSAKEKGAEIVFMHNESILVGGTVETFEEAVLDVYDKAMERYGGQND
ncbi:MAG: cyclic 2,3-diphosphoglycerate synthetase [Candidatus Natronoplasma sp.]